ncbi:MAG: prenyltransferase [Armatimonadota bacterium]|nr:prenyltransferase [Armatimonadota bacterium]MDR5697147.1 prenyltransferase [Armatimonadota bacterium]
MRRLWWMGLWRLADPKISLASMASILLGAAAAARVGPIDWGWLSLTVGGVFAIEVAKNASGEIVDFDSGADLRVGVRDRSPFSGGKRVLVDGLLTRRQTAAIAAASYLLGAGAGLWVAVAREPRVLWIGLVGVGLAYFYHGAPLRLSYRGLGEIAVGLAYGPLIASGTYLVQRQALDLHVALLSVPLGLLIAAFLWINEFPDFDADLAAGKRTLVVRLGRERAAHVFAAILAAAFAIAASLPATGAPPTVLAGLLGVVPAATAARRLLAAPTHTPRIVPAQAQTLLSFLLYSLGTGVGLLAA